MRGLLSFLALSILAGDAFAAEAVPKAKPAWTVEYAEQFCALMRLPDGGQPGVIIRARPLSAYFELLILTPLISRKRQEIGQIIFNFGDGPSVDGYFMRSFDLPARGLRVIETSMPADQFAKAEKLGSFRAMSKDKFDLSIPLPALTKARRALETCTEDLLKSWNVVRTWAVAPKEARDLRSLFLPDDYPSALVEANKQGTVSALMEIAPDGSITSCKAQEIEGDPRFEAATCKVFIKRAKFAPALDASGHPVKSYYLSPPIRFVLAG